MHNVRLLSAVVYPYATEWEPLEPGSQESWIGGAT